jgi:hypothetical protein
MKWAIVLDSGIRIIWTVLIVVVDLRPTKERLLLEPSTFPEHPQDLIQEAGCYPALAGIRIVRSIIMTRRLSDTCIEKV